jgi:very-short-patch-repair endonuclease
VARTRFEEGDGTIERARALRRNATPAEDTLWSIVRGSAVAGYKFRRQQRFGAYYVDLVCHGAKLVVEIDGESHAHWIDADAHRTAYFRREGYREIRFTNADVITNPEGVYSALLAALTPSPSHSASPSGPLPRPRSERGL